RRAGSRTALRRRAVRPCARLSGASPGRPYQGRRAVRNELLSDVRSPGRRSRLRPRLSLMPLAPLPDGVVEFLKQPHAAVISTVRSDGAPYSAATWYDWDDGRLLGHMDFVE